MDPYLIYAKTPIGDEAVRQSTRVVQRNLRMVLVQVDGKMSVEELASKIGNPRLVETALRELEEGGYIAPTIEAVSVWEECKRVAQDQARQQDSAINSGFSSFGTKTSGFPDVDKTPGSASSFSSFGKPILPANSVRGQQSIRSDVIQAELAQKGLIAEQASLRLGRLIVLSGLAIFVLLLATTLFFPYERFKSGIEASATHLMGAPVEINEIGFAVFPGPHLKLSGVRIGNPVDSTIEEVRVGSLFSMLVGKPERISRMEIRGAQLASNRLVAMPIFGGGYRGGDQVAFREIHIESLQVSAAAGLAMRDLHGEIKFRDDGTLEMAKFETADRGLQVEAQPGMQEITLNIEGRAWQPLGLPMSFSALQAKGSLMKNRLLIRNIDTVTFGGILRGNWLLDWGSGLVMTGEGELLRLDAGKLSTAFVPALKIEGEMSGEVRLRATGSDWNTLGSNAEITLNSEISRGLLLGADLGEAVRRGGVSEVRAGSTKFDRLQSTLIISPRQIVARNINLDAGMMTATGQLIANRNGQVEGLMTVTMQTSVSNIRKPIRIYGNLPDLAATAQK
jgi:hypothetical protein